MPSRPFLILGNILAITVTIAAFAQAVSWTIAGILILVFLVLPLLVSLTPSRAQIQPHLANRIPTSSNHPRNEVKPQHKPEEKHSLSSHQASTKTETRPHPKLQTSNTMQQLEGASGFSSNSATHVSPIDNSSPLRPPATKQGPDLNPTIAVDDYVEYDVDLEIGKNFLGEAAADGLINVYLLDEENMDNLDEGEEFWSETGEEGVETAKLEFTAPSKGKWYFVVENADDRSIIATVKMHKGPASATSS